MNFPTNLILFSIISVTIFNFVAAQKDDVISCYKCNNKDDPKCLSEPDSINAFCKEKSCVTYINTDGYLYRDCKSQLPPNFDCTKSELCKECNSEKCNKELNFPEQLRQKCYKCEGDGENCLKNSKLNSPIFCPKHPDKCFTYVYNNKTTIRDCLSNDVKNNLCTNTKDKLCIQCDQPLSGCNNQNGEDELRCYECNDKDEKCKRSDEQNQDKCTIDSKYLKTCSTTLLGRDEPKELCYILQNGNNVDRGCYVKNQKLLALYKNSSLQITEKEKNGNCIKDLNCIKCSDNDKCKNDNDNSLTNLAKACDKYTTSCYRYDDKDGKTVRDCGVPPNDEIQSTSYCYSDKCIAQKISEECFQCDSEKDGDENCVQLKNTTKLAKVKCDSKCVVKIKDNGHTVRGCSKDVLGNEKDCDNDKLCHACLSKLSDTNPCNGDIFPMSRAQCYQCTKCNDVQQEKPYPCSIFQRNETCYMYEDDKGDITRGCASNAVENKNCENAKEKCYKCTNDKCNNLGKMKDPSRKCIKCDSNNDNDYCKWGFSINQATNCKNQAEFWKTEKCYTCNEDGKVTRGCEQDSKDALSDKCIKCEGDGCNNYDEFNFTCIRCDSVLPGQESCAKKAEGIKPSKCFYPVTKTNAGCYVDYDVEKGTVQRGCLGDFDIKDRSLCFDNSYKYCVPCYEKNCNVQEISGSSKLSVKISVASVFMITLITHFNI